MTAQSRHTADERRTPLILNVPGRSDNCSKVASGRQQAAREDKSR